MDEQEKLINEVQLGRRAEEIIDDEMVQDVLKLMRDNIWAGFCNTNLGDEQTLIQLRHMLNAVDSFESNFKEIMETGQLAKATLDELEGQSED